MAFALFMAVAVASIVQGAQARSSLAAFKQNVLDHSFTSHDIALESAIVSYKLSAYLRGEGQEQELRASADVITARIAASQINFTDSAIRHTTIFKEAWADARVGVEAIIEGSRDPQLIESTFANLDTARIHAKEATDAWNDEVLTPSLLDIQMELESEERLFSIFAPIAALGAAIVVILAVRARGQARLQAANRQLIRVNEEKTHFVTQVSHELKTPLTSVISFTDLLIRKSDVPLSDRQSNHLRIVKRNAEYLRLRINDLIDVSQLETGPIHVERKEVDIRQLLDDLQKSFGPIVERKRQTLEIEPLNDSFSLTGDHLRLLQVLSSLVGNASKYSNPGTTITVGVTGDVDTVSISVQDQGYGMTDEEKDRAFERFYRGTSINTRGESGAGIGLAVSKSIIEAHGGTIGIEDAAPRGSRVTIRLPGKIFTGDHRI